MGPSCASVVGSRIGARSCSTTAAVGWRPILPIGKVAALANAGTLIAFMAVGTCLLVLRRRAPDAPRPFRVRAVWLVGLGAIGGCLYLFVSLPTQTLLWCLVWNAVGLGIYAFYRQRRGALERRAVPAE